MTREREKMETRKGVRKQERERDVFSVLTGTKSKIVGDEGTYRNDTS